MFTPPFCPFRDCIRHTHPQPGFFLRKGYYQPRCRRRRVQRFRCHSCGRTFSAQTFRMDYRDHKPELNAALVRSIASGQGLRRSSRDLNVSLRCTELKLRKIRCHLERLNQNLSEGAEPTLRNAPTGRGAHLAAARAAIRTAMEAKTGLGNDPRRPQTGELLSWRQDWGRRSVHPRSRAGTRLDRWRPRNAPGCGVADLPGPLRSLDLAIEVPPTRVAYGLGPRYFAR